MDPLSGTSRAFFQVDFNQPVKGFGVLAESSSYYAPVNYWGIDAGGNSFNRSFMILDSISAGIYGGDSFWSESVTAGPGEKILGFRFSDADSVPFCLKLASFSFDVPETFHPAYALVPIFGLVFVKRRLTAASLEPR